MTDFIAIAENGKTEQKYQPINRFIAFLRHLWYNTYEPADILSAVFFIALGVAPGLFCYNKRSFYAKSI
ncbi:MAG: hypothetical protein KBT14_02720, partial [Proteobacteria bacterium]|nr:hypothetical protein [Candidatus Enterousia onthequi]